MSRSRDIADLGGVTTRLDQVGNSDGALSNRNMVINGAMQVAQRGTSLTGIGSNAGGPFICDRFQHTQGSTGGSGVMTMEQSTDATDGFGSSLKLTVTTADTLSGGENVGIRYRTEGQDVQQLKFGTSNAEKFTVSFWVKSSLVGTYSLQAMGNARESLASYNVISSNTWEYKTVTFNGDTSGAISNANTVGLQLVWHLDAGASDITSAYDWSTQGAFRAVTGQVNFMATSGATWQITGVQLEVGDTSTPFEHISVGDQLQKCMRYFCKNGTNSSQYYAYVYTSSHKFVHVQYPVQMRATPTASFTMSNGSFTTFNHDNVHWKAYVSSAYNDTGTYRLEGYSFDAEL